MSTPDDTQINIAPVTGLSFELVLDEYKGTDHEEAEELTSGGTSPRMQMSAVTGKWAKRQKKRDWLAAWALYLAKHRGNIGYRQYRPVDVNRPLTTVEHQYITIDCSSMVQWLYARGNSAFKAWGGLPDPSQFGHTGYGNTTSQEAHGKPVDVPAKGDVAFYNGHEALVVHLVKANPRGSVVVSHGSESGPLILPANYRNDLHGFKRFF